MLGFILFIMIMIALALIPYRKIYNHMNQLIDVKTILISILMMCVPLAWRLFSPDKTDASAPYETGITGASAGLTNAVGALGTFADVLSWLIAFAGLVMIGFTVLTASEHQKKIKRLNEMHAAEDK